MWHIEHVKEKKETNMEVRKIKQNPLIIRITEGNLIIHIVALELRKKIFGIIL